MNYNRIEGPGSQNVAASTLICSTPPSLEQEQDYHCLNLASKAVICSLTSIESMFIDSTEVRLQLFKYNEK